MAKILASRLHKVLPYLINHDQSGCMKGRSTFSNIRSMMDVINYANSNNLNGLLAFIDYKKAFDTVKWSFLFDSLKAFNFGPNHKKNYSVISLVKLMKKNWKDISWMVLRKNSKNFYESNLLKLNCNKAKIKLKWKSVLSFYETINMVTSWYKSYYSKPKKIHKTSFYQIREYEKLLKKRLI